MSDHDQALALFDELADKADALHGDIRDLKQIMDDRGQEWPSSASSALVFVTALCPLLMESRKELENMRVLQEVL